MFVFIQILKMQFLLMHLDYIQMDLTNQLCGCQSVILVKLYSTLQTKLPDADRMYLNVHLINVLPVYTFAT